MASLDPVNVGRDLNDPVAVVAGEIRFNAVLGDDRGFFLRRAGASEELGCDLFDLVGLQAGHRIMSS